jgi:ribose/xylose/arabinose/galactoside ABC-type transport system permease subunit
MTAISEIKPPASTTSGASRGIGRKIAWFFLNNGIFIALIVEVLVFALIGKEKFYSPAVLAIILQNASVVGILMPIYAMAMISGIVDFSTVQVGALSGTVFAVLVTVFKLPWWVAVLGAMGLAITVSLLNGWVVIKLKIPSIVATLVGGGVAFGLAFFLADRYGQASQVKVIVPVLRQVWTVKPLGLPLTVYFMFILYVIIYLLLNHTRLGAHLYSVGANPDATRRAGIDSSRLIIFTFTLLALATTATNILYNVRVMNAGPYISPANTASGAGISVTLVAALFAGIGLFGGTGRVEFTLAGLLFFSVLLVGMGVIGFPAQLRVAVDGIAIVLALMLDSTRRYLSSR